MKLTQYTDYGLRTLIALSVNPGEQQTVTTISRAYGISRSHLVKVVARLAARGYVETARGKGGGVWLARPPAQIRVGDVVRDMESELGIVECLELGGGRCAIAPCCRLKGVLAEATQAFLTTLDRYTLEDLVQHKAPMARILGIPISTQGAATNAPA
jgi:Rrf2 family nitric oxide-sensitive transcriptional repressor